MVNEAQFFTRLRNRAVACIIVGTLALLGAVGHFIVVNAEKVRDAANRARAVEVIAHLQSAASSETAMHDVITQVTQWDVRPDLEVAVLDARAPFGVLASTAGGSPARDLTGLRDPVVAEEVKGAAIRGVSSSRAGELDVDERIITTPLTIPLSASAPATRVVVLMRLDGSGDYTRALENGLRQGGIVIALWMLLVVAISRYLNWRIDRSLTLLLDELREKDRQAQLAMAEAEAAHSELRDYKLGLDQHALVAVTDAAGVITHVNDLFCKVSKYTREELIGQTHRIVNSGVHSRAFWSEVWRTVAHGNVWHGQVCNRASDGSHYWLETTLVPILDSATGKVARYVAMRTDISQQKNAEQELRRAMEAAEAATQAKSSFLANMSHEIRTPMTAILGYVDLLRDAEIGRAGPAAEYLETVERNGEHLLSVINDVLDIAKIEAGGLQIECLATDPVRIVEEIVSLMRVRALSKNLALSVSYLTPVPSAVLTDPTRLRQILVNLVGNAIKFTDTGGVELRMAFDAAQSELRLDVVDSGIGIPEEQRATLFQAFQQGDVTTTRKFGGTGLGLNISQHLARMLGGQLTFSSESGVGSTFTATIHTGPVDPVCLRVVTGVVNSDKSDSKSVKRSPTAATATNALRGSRVLLVEDGPDNQRLISHHLRKAGAEVRVADNGRLALEALTTDGTVSGELQLPAQFDFVLTDMQMPEMDGYELARVLRERGWTRSIIALTAHAMSGDGEKCIAAGCNAYATKPIDRDELIALCARHRVENVSPEKHESPTVPYFEDEDMQALAIEFARALPTRVRDILTLIDSGQWYEARRGAHQIKGAGGGYGFPEISEAAARLERACVAGTAEVVTAPAQKLLELCDCAAAACAGINPSEETVSSCIADETRMRRRVLIIDDSAELSRLVNKLLSEMDLDVLHALDGGAGLDLARQQLPDLILLDFDLPVMDGLSVIKQLRMTEATSRIPVLFLTGSEDHAIQMQAFDRGANDFIRKPFHPAELKARVRAALHTQALLAELERQATHDKLTGLPNRSLLYRRLNQAIEQRRADPNFHYALLFLDLDGFKRLNDTRGHDAGDELLRQIAKRLEESTRTTDHKSGPVSPFGTAARLGGDEFVILLARLAHPDDSVRVAERLQEVLGAPYSIEGEAVTSSASIGIAPEREEHGTAEDVIHEADQAMYAAKLAGKAQSVVYQPNQAGRAGKVAVHHA